jgi:hypothetical protein
MASTDRPEVPGLNSNMAVSCGPSKNGGEFGQDVPAVWLTIREGGKNKTIMLATVNAIQLGQQILRAADEAE